MKTEYRLTFEEQTVITNGKTVVKEVPKFLVVNGTPFEARFPKFAPKWDGATKENCVYADITVLNTGIKLLFVKIDEPEGEIDIESATPAELHQVTLEANTITLGVMRGVLSKDSQAKLDVLIKEAMANIQEERIAKQEEARAGAVAKIAQLAAGAGKTIEELLAEYAPSLARTPAKG